MALVNLGVGTTYRCCYKFSDNAEAWPSLSGLVDELTIVHYISWFATNISKQKLCVFVLGHIHEPLERPIFGISKTKTRFRSNTKTFSGKDSFEIILVQLMKYWSEVKHEALESTWNIPRLSKFLWKNSKNFWIIL